MFVQREIVRANEPYTARCILADDGYSQSASQPASFTSNIITSTKHTLQCRCVCVLSLSLSCFVCGALVRWIGKIFKCCVGERVYTKRERKMY